MMYERFTHRARNVIQLASQEAQRFNHQYVDTEHILLGLIREGSGVAAHVLKNLKVDLRKVRLEIEKIVQSGPDKVTVGKLPQTPGAKKAIAYSMDAARSLGHNYVGTEHLLLGLLREEEGVAAQVLRNLRLNLEDVRTQVLGLLGHDEPSSPLLSRDAQSSPLIGAMVGPAVEDVSWLPAEIQSQVLELNAQIQGLEQNKEEAVAEQDFELAANLRDQANQLKKTRNSIVGTSLPRVNNRELAQRLSQFQERIESLRQQEQEAISKGYFGMASKLRVELDRLQNQWVDVWHGREGICQ
jgi:ATP-dependent Clp protease ATP-binding subunit ClpA